MLFMYILSCSYVLACRAGQSSYLLLHIDQPSVKNNYYDVPLDAMGISLNKRKLMYNIIINAL